MYAFTYETVDQDLVQVLPVLRSAHEQFRTYFHDCLPQHYALFSEVFRPFLEALLALPSGSIRDTTLRRAFGFADALLATGNEELSNLVWVELTESLDAWWFSRARDFMGPLLRKHAERYEAGWTEAEESPPAQADPQRAINDSWGVQAAVAELFRQGGIKHESLGDWQP